MAKPGEPRKGWKALTLPYDQIMQESDIQNCYMLSDKTVAMLLSQTDYFYWTSRWDFTALPPTDEQKALIKQAASMLEYQLMNGGDCDGCVDYALNSEIIEYAPSDPFNYPEEPPVGYAFPPWYSNAAIPIPGILPTDAMVNGIAALPTIGNLPDLLTSGFPRFRVTVNGAVEVEIEFIKVPQGGFALIVLDDDVSTADVVDLNSINISGLTSVLALIDVAFEPDLIGLSTHEIRFDTEAEHHIDVTFLPNVGATIILGMGGGIRRVTICGEELENTMACCDDLTEQIDGLTDQITAITTALPRTAIDGLPLSVTAPNRPRSSFITDPLDTSATAVAKRLRAACATVYRYTGEIVKQLGNEYGAGLLPAGWAAVVATIATGGAAGLIGVGIAGLTGIFAAALLSDYDAIDEVICCFQDKLGAATGNTFDIFKGLLDSPDCDLSANAQAIALIIHLHNQMEFNYKLFNTLLSDEYASDVTVDATSSGRCKICQPCAVNHVLGSNPFGVILYEGVFVPGVGYRGEAYTTPQGVAYTRLKMDILCPEPGYIKTAELDVAYKNNGGGGSMFVGVKDGPTTQVVESGGFGGGTNVRGITTWTNPASTYYGDRISVRQNTPVANGGIILYAIKSGPGSPPLP